MCTVPSAAFFIAGAMGFLPGAMMGLSLLAAVPLGGAYSACLFCISKMLRDDPGFIWYDFKRKFAENRRQARLPGLCYIVLLYAAIALLGIGPMLSGGEAPDATAILYILSILIVSGMCAPYLFLIIAYVDIKTLQALKNSVLLSFAHIGRSFAGMLAGSISWIAFILFWPASLVFAPLFFIFGFTIPMLLNLLWIWPLVDAQFSIEKTLRGQ